MPQPNGHYVEVDYHGKVYRYYGYAHMKRATCVGEGDWRGVLKNGEEISVSGALVPADVLHEVVSHL